jgi:DNA-binding transcriptional regulator LsrR (DeoR family)
MPKLPIVDEKGVQRMLRMYKSGMPKRQIAISMGISNKSVDRYLEKAKHTEEKV